MNKRFFLSTLLALSLILIWVLPVFAQDYSFSVPEVEAHIYLESDGSAAIEYFWYFENASGAHPIDFVVRVVRWARISVPRRLLCQIHIDRRRPLFLKTRP